jgi:hypothetical protein
MERIGLDQRALQIQRAQQLFESGPLAGFMGVVGLLGEGDAKSPGLDGDMGDEPMVPVCRLHCRASQGLAIAH